MSDFNLLPRILIVDDRFGRIHPDRKNEERANLCRQYLLEDVTFDEIGNGTGQKIKKPVAQVVFCRGQRPVCSTIGDTVENDLAGTLEVIRKGWQTWQPNKPRWAMVLLDLCFYTGPVTEESEREKGLGMPLGRDGDDNPQHYFGLQLLRAIFHEFSELPVVILSSKPRQKVSLALSCSGAYDFLKTDDEQGAKRLQQCLYYDGFIADSTRKIIGHSKALLLALRAARRAASTQKNVRQAESENPRARQREIEPDAVNKLCTYDWPGNIRELRSCIYRAVDNYPRVEHLAPIHIQLFSQTDMSKNTVYVQQASVSIQAETHQNPHFSEGHHAIVNMNELIQFINEFSFDSASVVELHGQLGELRAACARLLARYVIAALKIRNKNPTPTHPFGEPNIEGAMKLMTGNQRLNQTKPARLLKRLLKIDQEGIKTLVLSEPLLKKAAERVGLFFHTEKKE
jgi:hypothetical protein